jgi:hypothetical protein
MAKDPSPLLGYNNNIRHRNRVFHIQTEDSGVRHPHVITHLFMDGGRILKSIKTSYAEHVGAEQLADVVRKMMRDQHKTMLIALRDGQFDPIIDGGDAPVTAVSAPPAPAVSAAPAPVVSAPPAPAVSAPPPEAPKAAPAPEKPAASPPPKVESPEVAILERAAAAAPRPTFEAPLDLTPPPANLFRQRGGGAYSTVVDPPSSASRAGGAGAPRPATRPPPASRSPASRPPGSRSPASRPPGAVVAKSAGLKVASVPAASRPEPQPSGAPAPRAPQAWRPQSPAPSPVAPEGGAGRAPRPAPAAAVKAARPGEGRYGAARPAAIFGQMRPSGGGSIFGDDIISDKSLDEVIMSYLADDVGEDGADVVPKSRKARGSDPSPRK